MKVNNSTDFNIKNIGKVVTLYGWVAKKRNLGGLIFIDLRDRSGIIQLVVKPDNKYYDLAETLKNEYVIKVVGEITERESKNKNLLTGDIEVIINELEILNTSIDLPFNLNDTTALEDTRLKYRYLDLRRSELKEKLEVRHKITFAIREYLNKLNFLEIETPILCKSTPEGARDYLVPSRIFNGKFYALPQSPQIFKQLLMVGGMERYFQIAKCFRDEDLRADRQPDFTQIDIETSFLSEDQILTLTEGLIQKIYKDVINYDVKLPLRRINYDEAVDKYGSDKPDTRFDMHLISIKEILAYNSADLFTSNKYIKAIKVENVADVTSRKVQDEYNLTANKFNMKSFIYLKMISNKLEGSIIKFLSEEEQEKIINLLDLKNNDLVVIGLSNIKKNLDFGLGALRSLLAKKLNLIAPNTYDILWVVNFPLFEKSEETGEITPCHHPFTRPKDEDLDKLETEPYKVYSYSYDIVMNGYEAGGGSLRIYDQDVQKRIFKVLGFTNEDISRKFGFFVEALKYGTPPHGGLAFGLDRLTMILSGTDNIRDVIAFPKNLSAVCPMSNAPRPVDDKQLEDLGIKVVEKE